MAERCLPLSGGAKNPYQLFLSFVFGIKQIEISFVLFLICSSTSHSTSTFFTPFFSFEFFTYISFPKLNPTLVSAAINLPYHVPCSCDSAIGIVNKYPFLLKYNNDDHIFVLDIYSNTWCVDGYILLTSA